ncbi:A24 family peptidase [Nitratiruptor sp. YY09-18]|uniref:prepilin peptidase n=1 Tax=Nitratiruptor sp. YY09-18 TaxID=2724901 RepID=UPI001936F7FA|nr:A24 family peptidase [Nitratiruptor sp. YY09-18]BCD67900.1 leader peptidase / N-methyltransferase [Nitratiruptor sp. YY09-18]
MEYENFFTVIFATLFGLIFGSFLNVVILRIPQGMSIAFPASHCPKCKNRLKWWHNIPVLSWILLGGKCTYCKSSISIQYPFIELATAFIFAIVFFKEGASLYAADIAITFSLLLALSIIDLRFKAVPDSINLLAALLAIFSSPDTLTNLKNALLVAGAMSMLRFFVSYYVTKKEMVLLEKFKKERPWIGVYYPKFLMIEAMGEGDIIVGFTMGALLGIKLIFVALFLAALIALPVSLYYRYRYKDYALPFIPFLTLGTFLTYIFADSLGAYLDALTL